MFKVYIPLFAGIHYAIICNHLEVFNVLLPHEHSLLTLERVFIPTKQLSNFNSHAFMDK